MFPHPHKSQCGFHSVHMVNSIKTVFYQNTSTISMSSRLFPADFKAALEAGAGPMPITFGSQPTVKLISITLLTK